MKKDIICPYCGCDQYIDNATDWVEHNGDSTNHECEGCKKTFKIKAIISIEYEVVENVENKVKLIDQYEFKELMTLEIRNAFADYLREVQKIKNESILGGYEVVETPGAEESKDSKCYSITLFSIEESKIEELQELQYKFIKDFNAKKNGKDRIVVCKKCSSKDIKNEKQCNNCGSEDIFIEEVDSFSTVMDNMIADFKEKNKPVYEFLEKNETTSFVKKLLDYANEESELIPLNQQELKIVDTCNYRIQKNYSNTGLNVAINWTQSGESADSYAGEIYVKLPASKKFFVFSYAC